MVDVEFKGLSSMDSAPSEEAMKERKSVFVLSWGDCRTQRRRERSGNPERTLTKIELTFLNTIYRSELKRCFSVNIQFLVCNLTGLNRKDRG